MFPETTLKLVNGIHFTPDNDGVSVAIGRPGHEDQYYLITQDEGIPMSHLIDLQAPGNGTLSNPLGDVVQKNSVIDPQGGYLSSMIAIEDKRSLVNSWLYLLKHNPDLEQTQIIGFEVTQGGFGSPKTLATFTSGHAPKGMHLTPDGKHLLITESAGKRMGFFSFTGGSTSVRTYRLAADHSTLTFAGKEHINGGITPGGMLNFSGITLEEITPNSEYVYLSVNNPSTGATIGPNGVITPTDPPTKGTYRYHLSSNQLSKVTDHIGPIRRASNDHLYLFDKQAAHLYEISQPQANPSVQQLHVPSHFIQDRRITSISQTPHIIYPQDKPTTFSRKLDQKEYEISDHLGNVRVTFSDRKLAKLDNNLNPDPTSFRADITSASALYPFGAPMPGKGYNTNSYTFGFQGQEKDDNIKGDGNSINYKYRMHDPRLGRFLSLDPLEKELPWNSPYAFSENKLGLGVEFEGLELSPFPYLSEKWYGEALLRTHEISRSISNTTAELARNPDAIAARLQGNWANYGEGEDWIKSMKIGGEASASVNKYKVSAEAGLFSTGENYAGLFLQLDFETTLDLGTDGSSLTDFSSPTIGANLFLETNTGNPFNKSNGNLTNETKAFATAEAGYGVLGLSSTTEQSLDDPGSKASSSQKVLLGSRTGAEIKGGVKNTTSFRVNTDQIRLSGNE